MCCACAELTLFSFPQAALAYAYSRVIFPKTQQQLATLAGVSTVLYDTMLNFKTVKLFGNEDEELRRFEEALQVSKMMHTRARTQAHTRVCSVNQNH